MADYQEKYPLDYRIGGDTVDDFAQKIFFVYLFFPACSADGADDRSRQQIR